MGKTQRESENYQQKTEELRGFRKMLLPKFFSFFQKISKLQDSERQFDTASLKEKQRGKWPFQYTNKCLFHDAP